jgi:integrase
MIRVHVRQRPDRPGFQAFWNDPFTERRKTKTLKAERRKDAVKEAAVLESQLRARTEPETSPTSWDDFRARFNDEYLPSRSKATRAAYHSALKQFEIEIGHPDLLQINESILSQYQAALRKRDITPATVAGRLRHLKAALRWAARMRLIPRVPMVEMPRVVSTQLGKGRPLTEIEFKRFIAAIEPLHTNDPVAVETLTRLSHGLWLSGLRLGEAYQLSWESPPVWLDLTGGRYPRIHWSAEGQKSRKDEITPLTPDFADWISETPKDQRMGRVFPICLNGRFCSQHRTGRLISEIGEAAKIHVGDKKFASAHDLRRSFATRWSRKVRPVTLRTIMRHSDIKTTLSYYVDIEADDVGSELWGTRKK